MIDKLDIRIPRKASFTPSFQRKYTALQAMPKGPFRPAKFYEYAGDLREFGHHVRLNLYCRMEKAGNHKIELLDVGEMTRSGIIQEITEIFEVDPFALGIMRADFAVDLPDLPVQWFRETVRVEHKRFRSAMTSEPFSCEMGCGKIQTLYFGKRPNLIRIYDKRAEYELQYRNLRRKLKVDTPLEAMFPLAANHPVMTRVERQIGGRMPEDVDTLGKVFAPNFEYQPFAKLKILDHAPTPDQDLSHSFETYCTGLYLRSIAVNDGMQALKEFASQHSRGNAGWVQRKYRSFLPSATPESGITGPELHNRFAESLRRQLSR